MFFRRFSKPPIFSKPPVFSKPRGTPIPAQRDIRLHIPQQRDATQSSFDIHPKRVKEWVAELPLAHTGETARRLFQMLSETNRTRYDPDRRLDFLEQVRAPVLHITESLERHYTRTPLPLPEKSQKVAELAQAIQTEVAAGYEAVVADALAGASKGGTSALLIAIHRAIRAHARVLTTSYQTYTCSPSGPWGELNQLYLCAEQLDLSDKPVKEEQPGTAVGSTVARAYLRIVMLALADPFRLPQGEMQKVYDALAYWTEYISPRQMSDTDAPLEAPGMFQVNLARDEPPGPFDTSRGEIESCRIIDATRLVNLLREEPASRSTGAAPIVAAPMVATRAGSTAPGLLPGTLTKLVTTWSSRPIVRRPVQVNSAAGPALGVEVVLGLSALHQHSSQAEETAAQPGNPFDNPFGTAPAPESPSSEVLADIEYTPRAPAPPPREARPPAPPIHSAILFPVEQNEFCLYWNRDLPSNIQVGEIVGIRKQQPAARTWKIAVVRWLMRAQGQFESGLDWLAPAAVPVLVTKPSGPASDPAEYLRALVLPQGRTPGEGAGLIVPPLQYRVGDSVTLQIRGREKRGQLLAVLEQTSSFILFRVRLAVGEPGSPPGSDRSATRGAHDFDSLWSTL